MQIHSDPFKGFRHLRCMLIFGGIVGTIQSLLWFGMSIIGITAYSCSFDRVSPSDTSLGAITQQTFYHMYFGDCSPKADIDFTELDRITLKLNAHQVNIWVWVYFAIHIVWFCSSISLFRKFDKSRLVLLNTLLLIWVIIALAISAIDLALGILFGMDYGDILALASDHKYQDYEMAATLVAGMTSSMSMMIMALRGFILWVLNVGLLCYFFVHTFIISKASTNLSAGHDNEGFVSETQSEILRQPIDAYSNLGRSENQNNIPLQLNVEPLKRATAMSVDSLLQRHYQRYPPGNDTKDENSPSQKNGYAVLADNNSFKPYPTVPDPDYSPQMIPMTIMMTPTRTHSEPNFEGRSAL